MFKKLKDIKIKLTQLLEEIDGLEKKIYADELILTADSCVHIKWLGQTNSYIHVFSFMDEVTFVLHKSESHYDIKFYREIFNNSLSRLILIKLEKPYQDGSFMITHTVEAALNTKLRDLYRNE
jgi:hypothetical protein